MIYNYKAACISRTGLVRQNNEDNFYFRGKSLPVENRGLHKALYAEGTSGEPVLLAVFDGMGGEVGGELAAAVGAETLRGQVEQLKRHALQPRVYVDTCIQRMNEAVFQRSRGQGYTRCGTTTALLYFALDQFYIGNIGDSRIYRYGDGGLQCLSEDDVLYDPDLKNQRLTQFLGVDPTQYSIRSHIKKGTLCRNDLFLLCTDGLYNAVPEETICRILDENAGDMVRCAEKLADAAEVYGGEDNCTVLLIAFTHHSWWLNKIK